MYYVSIPVCLYMYLPTYMKWRPSYYYTILANTANVLMRVCACVSCVRSEWCGYAPYYSSEPMHHVHGCIRPCDLLCVPVWGQVHCVNATLMRMHTSLWQVGPLATFRTLWQSLCSNMLVQQQRSLIWSSLFSLLLKYIPWPWPWPSADIVPNDY